MKITINLNDKVYKALKHHAAESGETLSTIIENAVKVQILEDLEDLETAKWRAKESTYSFDKLVEKFKSEGLL